MGHPDHMLGQWAVDLMSNSASFVAGCFVLRKIWNVNESRAAIIAFALYISGGLGNALDPVLLPDATDFIQVPLGQITATTNVSDIYILASVGLMVYEILKETKEKPRFVED